MGCAVLPVPEPRLPAVPAGSHLDRADLPDEPFSLFERWWAQAREAGSAEPAAMTLATATPDGAPWARTVLLRGFDDRGFAFYTNYESRKGRELAANPRASLLFHWPELGRQVLVGGDVARVPAEESDAYFAGRPRESRLGAWASAQGRPLRDREQLEAQLREVEERFPGEDVPRPEFWGGFRLVPRSIEFWQSGEFRLHDRFVYVRDGDGWTITRLSP
jgi:pyridoxamine 5'-phosphate oxidase